MAQPCCSPIAMRARDTSVMCRNTSKLASRHRDVHARAATIGPGPPVRFNALELFTCACRAAPAARTTTLTSSFGTLKLLSPESPLPRAAAASIATTQSPDLNKVPLTCMQSTKLQNLTETRTGTHTGNTGSARTKYTCCPTCSRQSAVQRRSHLSASLLHQKQLHPSCKRRQPIQSAGPCGARHRR